MKIHSVKAPRVFQPTLVRRNSFYDSIQRCRPRVVPLIIETNRNGELYLHALRRVPTLSYIFRHEIRFSTPGVLIYVLLLLANLLLIHVDYSPWPVAMVLKRVSFDDITEIRSTFNSIMLIRSLLRITGFACCLVNRFRVRHEETNCAICSPIDYCR